MFDIWKKMWWAVCCWANRPRTYTMVTELNIPDDFWLHFGLDDFTPITWHQACLHCHHRPEKHVKILTKMWPPANRRAKTSRYRY